MTLHSSMRPDRLAHHHPPLSGWTTTWTDGPPSDWDEIRSRLRSLHPPKTERVRQGSEPRVVVGPAASSAVAGLTVETPDGLHEARVSWRRAEAPSPSSALPALPPLRDLLAAIPAVRWWQEHDPLLVQRTLLLVSLLLLVLLILQLL
jgi:hypothetical protein